MISCMTLPLHLVERDRLRLAPHASPQAAITDLRPALFRGPNVVLTGLSGAVLRCGVWCCHTTWAPPLRGVFCLVLATPRTWPIILVQLAQHDAGKRVCIRPE